MKSPGPDRTIGRRVLLATGLLLASAACTNSGKKPAKDIRSFGDIASGASVTLEKALRSAAKGGFAIEVPEGVSLRLNRPTKVPGNAELRGAGTLVAGADVASLLTVTGAHSSIHGLSFRTEKGHRVASAVAVQPLARHVTLAGLDVCAVATGVTVASGAKDVKVSTCRFRDLACGIALRGEVREVEVAECHFRDWRDRAIWVVGSSSRAPASITIDGCRIDPPAVVGKVRQPIQINGHDDRLIAGVSITNNHVRGSGTSYSDTSRPGAADLISLHRCRDFVVSRNTVREGGDTGITVSRQSRDGVVEENVCQRNDSAGICIGSRGSQKVSDIVVRSNVCEDNGQDRAHDGRDWALAGVLVVKGKRIHLDDNALRDTGAGSQEVGISLRQSSVSLEDHDLTAAGASVRKDSGSTIDHR